MDYSGLRVEIGNITRHHSENGGISQADSMIWESLEITNTTSYKAQYPLLHGLVAASASFYFFYFAYDVF